MGWWSIERFIYWSVVYFYSQPANKWHIKPHLSVSCACRANEFYFPMCSNGTLTCKRNRIEIRWRNKQCSSHSHTARLPQIVWPHLQNNSIAFQGGTPKLLKDFWLHWSWHSKGTMLALALAFPAQPTSGLTPIHISSSWETTDATFLGVEKV